MFTGVILFLCVSGVPQIDSWEPLYLYTGGGWGLSVTAVDVNEDDQFDLVFTGDYINIEYFENTASGFVQGSDFMADGLVLETYPC